MGDNHAGWLLFSSDGRTFKGPKDKRYFVLKPSERALHLYKREEDVVKSPSAAWDLTSYIIEKEYVSRYDNAFRVTTQTKSFLVAAENASDMNAWFAAIIKVGMRVSSDPADLARRDARARREEARRIQKEKESDEADMEKQKLTHRKQNKQLARKHKREDDALKRKSIREDIEQQWRHEDEKRKLDFDHKEEAEELADKIHEKNFPTTDPDELKRKVKVKQLGHKQAKEMLSFQQTMSKKDMKLSLKHQDELQKLVSDQQDEEENLADKHELDLVNMEERRKKDLEKLSLKCEEEMEKKLDEIQWRREKMLLARAAAQVIATQGAVPKSSGAAPAPAPAPAPTEEAEEEEDDTTNTTPPVATPRPEEEEESPYAYGGADEGAVAHNEGDAYNYDDAGGEYSGNGEHHSQYDQEPPAPPVRDD